MGSEIFFVLAVFVAVYVGIALEGWPWLRIDRLGGYGRSAGFKAA